MDDESSKGNKFRASAYTVDCHELFEAIMDYKVATDSFNFGARRAERQ